MSARISLPSCLQCGKETRTSHARFCSHWCHMQHSRASRERKCVRCGQGFVPKKRPKTAKYCSWRCFLARVIPAQCRGCGKDLQRKSGQDTYCSHMCANRDLRAKVRLSPRDCVTCGAIFQPRASRLLACSRPCGYALRRANAAAKRSVEPPNVVRWRRTYRIKREELTEEGRTLLATYLELCSIARNRRLA